jgi:hypothetical protein
MCRPYLMTVCVLFMTGTIAARPSEAQGISNSFTELRLLVRPGDTVTIIDATGKQTTARILDLSFTSLVLQVQGVRQEVLEAEVTTILQRRQDSLGNGALWGLSIGGAVGVVAVLALTDAYSEGGGALALAAGLVYAGLGAGVGVGMDAMVTKRQVIYQRPGSARLSIAPILGRDRAGARVSWRF